MLELGCPRMLLQATFDWSKQSQAQLKFQERRHTLHLLMGGRRDSMCIQEGKELMAIFGNELLHCPSLED